MKSSYIIRKYIKYIPLHVIFFEQEEERESWLFLPPNVLVQRKFIDPTFPFLYVSQCTYFYLATIWNKFATHKTGEPKTVSSITQEMTNYVACVFLFPSIEYQMSLETGKKKNRKKKTSNSATLFQYPTLYGVESNFRAIKEWISMLLIHKVIIISSHRMVNTTVWPPRSHHFLSNNPSNLKEFHFHECYLIYSIHFPSPMLLLWMPHIIQPQTNAQVFHTRRCIFN